MTMSAARMPVQAVRELYGIGTLVGFTDGQLLARYAELNDGRAFESLVARHGSMVVSTCRAILEHEHDVEDAFQATFVVLARKARAVRPDSLGGWLHRVAYRIAVHAKKEAVKRKRLESELAAMRISDLARAGSEVDVHSILHEEIERLPERERLPVVLCDLEGLTYEQAAARLRCTEQALCYRLAKARSRLRDRLSRRGVTGTVLGAVITASQASAASALPAAWTRAAVAAATGGPTSASVAALTQTMIRGMLMTQLKITSAAVAAVTAFASFGVVALVGGPQAQELSAASGTTAVARVGRKAPATAASPAQNVSAKGAGARSASREETAHSSGEKQNSTVTARGRVLDPDGKPVAGAKLYLGSRDKEATYPLRATTDSDGRFTIRNPQSGSPTDESAAHAPPTKVLATAQDYGCVWEALGSADRELTLRLVKDAAASGRIVDADGRPIANAKLTVDGVAGFTGAQKSGVVFVNTFPYMDYPWGAANGWLGALPDQGNVLTTSADGRFELTGVGPNRIVSLHLEGPEIATTDLGVISGTSVQCVAGASRPIRGVVRDKVTRQPLPGATVFVGSGFGWGNPDYRPDEGFRWGKAITDKEGRYELFGLAKPPKYHLKVRPPKGQLYFLGQVELSDPPGLTALTVDIDLAQGVTVRGKVTDKASHQPIAQARVAYYSLYGNASYSPAAQGSSATTETDGSYALTVHPGPGVIAVEAKEPNAYIQAYVSPEEQKNSFSFDLPRGYSESWLHTSGGYPIPQGNYNALVPLEPKETDRELVKDIALERGRELKGRVVGPDGQPIPGVMVDGLSPRLQSTETLEGSEFTVRCINPRVKRQLTFQHTAKNLGYWLKELPDEEAGPLLIKLQPCGSISGRLVDADGVPRVTNGRVYIGWPPFTVDKDGRFHVQGIVPGLAYRIQDNERSHNFRDGIVVGPGKDKNVGDFKVPDN
jgi:RNA polymerase sigma factor (sigma-70 family)